jgi:hypothetical protein
VSEVSLSFCELGIIFIFLRACIISRNKTISSQTQWLIPLILATWEAEIRRIMVGGQSLAKVTRAKGTGCVTQVIDHLPSNQEALSSNPISPPPKKAEIRMR